MPLRHFRILIVDDFGIWRESVRSILAESGRIEIVGEAADGIQAVELARQLEPDLVLLDISLPSLDGIEAAARILQLASTTKILFLTANNHPAIVSQSLKTGAAGYVLKADVGIELWPAIEAVLQGRQFVSSSVRGSSSVSVPRSVGHRSPDHPLERHLDLPK